MLKKPSPQDNNPPELFCLNRLRLSRVRSQKRFYDHDFLYTQVMHSLNERVADIKRDFKTPLLLGGRGEGGNSFSAGLTDSDILTDSETLPFKPHSFDLILSPLRLHWVNDIPGVLSQLKHILKPDGLLVGALFGGETLHELKHCLFQAESEILDGAVMRVAPMVSAQMMGGLLQRAGFGLPVTDIDRITVTYDHILDLMHDLRGMGETHKLKDVLPLKRSVIERANSIYHDLYGDGNGKLKATFEVTYFTGWSPHESQQKPLKRGSADVSLVEFMG